jgi:hypothetical protein
MVRSARFTGVVSRAGSNLAKKRMPEKKSSTPKNGNPSKVPRIFFHGGVSLFQTVYIPSG